MAFPHMSVRDTQVAACINFVIFAMPAPTDTSPSSDILLRPALARLPMCRHPSGPHFHLLSVAYGIHAQHPEISTVASGR